MNIELLSKPPISGEYEEHQFDAVGDCSFVLFEPYDDLPWVGAFGGGGMGKSAVATSENYAFVVSVGKA